MSGDLVVLDSVIIIDHFNGVDEATAYLEKVGDGERFSFVEVPYRL